MSSLPEVEKVDRDARRPFLYYAMMIQLKAMSEHPSFQGKELLDQGERILEDYNSDSDFPDLRYTAFMSLKSAHGL